MFCHDDETAKSLFQSVKARWTDKEELRRFLKEQLVGPYLFNQGYHGASFQDDFVKVCREIPISEVDILRNLIISLITEMKQNNKSQERSFFFYQILYIAAVLQWKEFVPLTENIVKSFENSVNISVDSDQRYHRCFAKLYWKDLKDLS